VHDTAVDELPEQVEDVYRAEATKMWRALVGYTGDPDVASDAVAEAFTRALRDQASVRDLTAWIWRVAFRLAAADLRSARRTTGLAEADSTIGGPNAAVPDLVRALRGLSPKQRLAVVLHDYADRPTDEVAEVLGSSRATVRVHLSQGRRRLRELLEERDA
jgi:RNA polymerase sigma-70 factor (ECF subfamily)